MSSYTLQIGFDWTTAAQGVGSLAFAFRSDGGLYGPAYDPKGGDQSDGTRYVYRFEPGETLQWEIYDLTDVSPGTTPRPALDDVDIPFERGGEAQLPFRISGYRKPMGAPPLSQPQAPTGLPGAVPGASYPYWTPTGATFTFVNPTKASETFTFTMTLVVSRQVGAGLPGGAPREERTFFVDPEMIVGSGGGH